MEKSEVVGLAVSAHDRGIASGQFNLFTGELEPLSYGAPALPEEAWLFDPDFGLFCRTIRRGKKSWWSPEFPCNFQFW
jgi:hypothetical protein